MAMLEVKDLRTSFFTPAGEVKAVNGVSFDLDAGKILGVVGESGSGKSTSLRNFAPDEIGVLNVAGKPLPFRSDIRVADNATYQTIQKVLRANNMRAYAIDDSQYLMGFEEMDSTKTGFEKFNSIGFNFIGLVRSIATMTDRDTIVYFLHHTEMGDDGRIKAKTLGKLIDNHYTLEGLFSVVLLADVDKDQYQFITQSNGRSTAKAPMGMLPPVMDNDLRAVDSAIREYWGMRSITDNEPNEKE